MQKLLIQLSEGKKILEKIEIGSSKDLNKLFDTLRTKIIIENANINKTSEDSKAIKNIDESVENMKAATSALGTFYSTMGGDKDVIVDNGIDKYSEIRSYEGGTSIYTMKESGVVKDDKNVLCKHVVKAGDIDGDKVTSIGDRKAVIQLPPSNKVLEGFFIMKCPHCGEMKCFKSNTDTLFHCKCGATYSTSKYVKIYGKCPNCSNNIGTIDALGKIAATLEGMNISDGIRCNKCESPVDFTYNEAKKRWVSLTE